MTNVFVDVLKVVCVLRNAKNEFAFCERRSQATSRPKGAFFQQGKTCCVLVFNMLETLFLKTIVSLSLSCLNCFAKRISRL